MSPRPGVWQGGEEEEEKGRKRCGKGTRIAAEVGQRKPSTSRGEGGRGRGSAGSGPPSVGLVALIINVLLPPDVQEMWAVAFFPFFVFAFSFGGCMHCISSLTQRAPGDL